MGGRGRGRGNTGGLTYEQLQSLGVGRGETVAPPTGGVPPPLFPKLDARPLPLEGSATMDYMLILKRQFMDYLHDSPAYVQTPTLNTDVERYSDKYKVLSVEGKSNARGGVGNMCWEHLPTELRPHQGRKTNRKRKAKVVDIDSKLKKLEQMEMKNKEEEGGGALVGDDGGEGGGEGRGEGDKEEEGEEGDEEALEGEGEGDDEMDDGTDYVDNYFDNGEGFQDEDENLDDGPVY